jgi:Pyridine nucleotide-disulphide oxidoreductase
MKTIDHALELRARIFGAFEMAEHEIDPVERRRWLTFVVVGRRADQSSPRSPRRCGSRATRDLRAIGIEIHVGTAVTHVDERGLETSSADPALRRIEAATKIWAAGVEVSPQGRLLADRAGVEVDRVGRMKVEPDLTIAGHPDIFVVGDLMSLDGLPGVAQVAIQSGRHAAQTIASRGGDASAVPAPRPRDAGDDLPLPCPLGGRPHPEPLASAPGSSGWLCTSSGSRGSRTASGRSSTGRLPSRARPPAARDHRTTGLRAARAPTAACGDAERASGRSGARSGRSRLERSARGWLGAPASHRRSPAMTGHLHPSADGSTDMASPQPRVEPAEAHDRKGRKREAKRRRDVQRLPDSYERFKILLEVIGEQRHVVDLEDHRARYAMVIMAATNAAVFLVASRVAGNGHLPAALPHWLLGVVVVYVAATLLFILTAVDCLRPRSLQRKGLLHWEGAVMHDVAEYETAWSEVRMDQLNQEAVLIAHMLARMIDEKYRANRRLYGGLAVLIVLGAVLLTILGVMSVIR